jgi:hypothetical protein
MSSWLNTFDAPGPQGLRRTPPLRRYGKGGRRIRRHAFEIGPTLSYIKGRLNRSDIAALILSFVLATLRLQPIDQSHLVFRSPGAPIEENLQFHPSFRHIVLLSFLAYGRSSFHDQWRGT